MSSSLKYVIIPAAGIGTRMKTDTPKQYIKLKNQQTILDTTIGIFVASGFFDKVIVALSQRDDFWQDSIYFSNPQVKSCIGGDTRFESVQNALNIINKQFTDDKNSWIFVHDGARPAVSLADIIKLYNKVKASKNQCGILAIPAFETVKQISNNSILATLKRDDIWLAQTPQLARLNHLVKAFKFCQSNKITDKVTDEASALELLGDRPIIVEGSRKNIKVTTKDDLAFINYLIKSPAI